MALDTTSFRNALGQAEPDRELVRDGAIQRFGYTDELSHRFPRRFLEETEPAPEQVREIICPAPIRLGSERGLPLDGGDVWTGYRKARGATSHVYDSERRLRSLRPAPGIPGGCATPARRSSPARLSPAEDLASGTMG